MTVAVRPADAGASRRPLWLGSALVAILCAAALLATSPGLPMVWDEGDAIARAEGIARWARRWLPGDAHPGPWSNQAVAQDWQYTTRREGHPALYGILIALGRGISGRWLPPLSAARFGPMMLFGLAAGAMFYRLGRHDSAAAAVGAVGALGLLPRVFAHAHFASFDGPLTSCWILAWATFPPASRGGPTRPRWPGAILWGTALGMTFSCKATGWLAPLPFLAWAAVYRDRRAARTLAVGLPVAVVTFFVLNPPLWHQPIQGFGEFVDLNLHRAQRLKLNIPIRFLGESHHLGHPLPWYNTLLWTAITVPLGTLLLAGLGTAAVLRRGRTDRTGILLLANCLVLLIVRALPMVPPHDGVRQFLPSFAFVAALAGLGSARILAWGKRRKGPICAKHASGRPGKLIPSSCSVLGLTALGLMYAGSLSSLLWYAPQWLSYYNLLIGGLPGAKASGMEPTYYWDGLDRSVLDWLHANTAPDEKIRFGSISAENIRRMRRWGTLRRGTQFDDRPGRFRWYVLQHRLGPWPWHPVDPWLVQNARPAYRKTIRSGGLGPWRLDVPLVEVYSYDQYLQACEATGRRYIGPGNSP